MDRPLPKRVPLQSPIRNLRVEYINSGWRIWLTANGDFTLGTFIDLEHYGHMRRVTLHEDGTESIFDITGD